jgi:ubiquinone/menaquinone biosynthesis C-methylase UbiE
MRRIPALRDNARRWQLDFDAARCYQECLVPVLFQPWAAQLVDRATLRPGSRVLDLACGTGVVARIAAEEIGARGQVVGIDLNSAVLSVADARGQVSGAHIQWRRGDAENLPLPDLLFDAVLCHQGFQFFPDRIKAALEIARVLRAGGQLALNVWCGPTQNPLAGAVVAALRNGGLPACCRTMRRPFSVHDQSEIAAPIEGAGFRILIAEVSRLWISAVDAKSFLRSFLRAMPFYKEIPVPKVDPLVCDAISALRPYIRHRALRVPSHAYTIVAVREGLLFRGRSSNKE